MEEDRDEDDDRDLDRLFLMKLFLPSSICFSFSSVVLLTQRFDFVDVDGDLLMLT